MLEFLARFQDIALLFSRIFLGIMFIIHGKSKMFGPKPGVKGFSKYLKSNNVPFPLAMAFIVATVEFWGGIMIIMGIFTRLVATLMAILIIVAMYVNIEKKGQAFKGGWELDLMILAICILMMAFGAGQYTFFALFGA